MNAGFASLTYLKSQLLAESLREDDSYDPLLLQLGLGVVGMFEAVCQRKFARAEGITEIFGADRCQFILSCRPVESIARIEYKETEADGWVDQVVNSYIRTFDTKAGIVYLPDANDAGPYYAQVRITYTAGYYIDTESDDASGAAPAGQTILPGELRTAWILQGKRIWELSDPLGRKIKGGGDGTQLAGLSLAGLDLVPAVKTILGDFTNYNLA